jgi:transcription initiation factor IIE alpha subunit
MREERRHEMGVGGHCICPKCEERMPHRTAVPCQEERCPKCGAKMLRENSHHHELFEAKKRRKEEKTNRSRG